MLRTIVVAVVVFAIFAAGGIAAFQVSQQSQNQAAQVQDTQTGEQIVQETGIYQFVDRAQDDFVVGFNDTVTVRNSSGTVLSEGTDYEWNSTDGTIKFINTSSVQDGQAGEINYGYEENTQEVQRVGRPLRSMTEAIGRLPLVAGGLGLSVLLIGFAGFLARVFGESGPGGGR